MRLAIRAYGVEVGIELDGTAELGDAVEAILPPGHARVERAATQAILRLESDGAAAYTLSLNGSRLASGLTATDAVGVLDARLRELIATESSEMVFVHAGVVGIDGRGLVLPGTTFAGKTELVSALLRAGATYYSDEFAVLDHRGLVHPYPRRLSIRERGTRVAHDVSAASLGAPTGSEPLSVAVIAVTRYEPGARWEPLVATPAAGAMHLLAHAGQTRHAPERVLDAVGRAAQGAVTLEGPRGEADATAAVLLSAWPPAT